MGSVTLRVRSIVWFVTGAVLAAGVAVMFMDAWRADAAPGEDDATFVPITPCRLADTRPEPNRVGTAGTLSAADTTPFAVHGTNGECTIPTEAVAVSMNVTALGASMGSFLTFWPDGDRPLAASLNPSPGQPPTPNAVTVDLSGAGAFNVYNDTGTVNVVIDINGFYVRSSLSELAGRLAGTESSIASLEATVNDLTSRTSDLESEQPFTVSADFVPELSPATSQGAGCYFPTFPTSCSFFGADTETMQEIAVTAPSSGTVTVTAVATIIDVGAWVECQIMETDDDPDREKNGVWEGASGSFVEVMTLVRSFEVDEGTTTFRHRCRNEDDGNTDFQAGTMTATWTPSR